MKLSEMQSSPDVGRPEGLFPICVAGKLVKELGKIDAEMFEVESEIDAAKAAERPARVGAVPPAAALEKKAAGLAKKADAVRERMKDHTIDLLVPVSGTWRQWVTKHPLREEETDPAGYARDRQYAGSVCNIDALVADLGDFVAKYGDEEPRNGSWEFVSTNAAPGDLTMLGSKVVGLHEQSVDLGKSRVAWQATRRSDADSE